MALPAFSDFRRLILDCLRKLEGWRLRHDRDTQRLEVLAQLSDDFLWKKAVWSVAIIGCFLAFILLPFCLCLLGIFLAPKVMEVLWLLTKGFMALMLLTFALAIWSARSKSM